MKKKAEKLKTASAERLIIMPFGLVFLISTEKAKRKNNQKQAIDKISQAKGCKGLVFSA